MSAEEAAKLRAKRTADRAEAAKASEGEPPPGAGPPGRT